jgi:Domain of unknown function (DUF4326)
VQPDRRGPKLKLVVHCKKEPFDVLIDRTTIWGNPFSHKPGTRARFLVGSREEAIARYEMWILKNSPMVALAKRTLRGKVLGCWCDPLACHGDVLARIANE